MRYRGNFSRQVKEKKYKLKDMGDNNVLNVSIEPGL